MASAFKAQAGRAPASNKARRGLSTSQTPTQRNAHSVSRRNERERNRVKQVNHGFYQLKAHVPLSGKASKKLSKVETLRGAVRYIKELQAMLDGGGQTTTTAPAAASPQSSHSIKSERADVPPPPPQLTAQTSTFYSEAPHTDRKPWTTSQQQVPTTLPSFDRLAARVASPSTTTSYLPSGPTPPNSASPGQQQHRIAYAAHNFDSGAPQWY